MVDPASFPIVRISARELRRRFNQLLENPPAGLREVLWKERHPAPERSGEPTCTRSQMISYVCGGTEIARAHRYLRPDGSIGGSGKPDPKLLIADGKRYIPF